MHLRNLIQVFSFLLIFPAFSTGQHQLPLITGKARFSVEQGTIECDLTLSEYAHYDAYVIRLNTGLNILNIQDVASEPYIIGYDRSLVDSLNTDETNAYYFPSEDRKGTFLPSKLRFQYVGKYPVIQDTLQLRYQKTDWRGNVAFNNHILRVDGLQSAWFPTIYDINNQYALNEVRYDIEIECSDCEYLYINGNEPVKGQKARFKSEVPREMYLFLGKYDVQKSKGITLLNTDFSETQLQTFSNLNTNVSNFLKSYTNIPYNQDIYWVQGNITSVSNAWSFISYPTFTTCGYPPYDLKSSFNESYKSMFLQTIAHELGHYYFGMLKKYNDIRENIINEGFAEFLSLKYLESIQNNDYVAELVDVKLSFINDKDFTFEPIGSFKGLESTNDRQTYAYDYQTIVLVCIEKEIGKEKMKKWIQLLLKENKPLSSFDFLKATLKQAVNNDKIYESVVNQYLLGPNTLEKINKMLQ